MRNINQNCIQCEEPMQGRANKKFCSNACRAQHFRDNPIETAAVITQVQPSTFRNPPVQYASPPIEHARVMPLAEEEDDDEDDADDRIRAKIAQKRKAEEDVELSKKLDGRYSKLVDECLKADGTNFNDDDDDELQAWLDEIDDLIVDYRSHPGIDLSAGYARERLDDLHWLRDKFNRLLGEWVDQPTSWRHNIQPVYFEMSTKRKKLLRAHLLLK
ncbi:hypothetical protein [Hymenobacter norwichensis]|uniref:hypothetical protein n=1 Tax=Hymenobacter norwichensis TaxID=223903 RepID=UPI0003B71812|nr:hypothetical protein [Hymenobacter norwichensis]